MKPPARQRRAAVPPARRTGSTRAHFVSASRDSPRGFHCPPHARCARGSALILALWALLLLSAAVFAWVRYIDRNILIASEANAGLDAKALAHSGVWVALHPAVTPGTPLLQRLFANDRGYTVKLTGEGGRIDLNGFFADAINRPDEAKLAIFKRYLERRGLNFGQRQALVDCMLDWLDPDNAHRLNGAEAGENYRPPNRGRFLSVEEIAEIKGAAPLVSHAGWQDDFTVWTRSAQIDLQAASFAVLAVLPHVGDARAKRFLELRQGKDKTDGTEDDYVFKDVAAAISFLVGPGPAAQELAPHVTMANPTSHILSVGQSGKVYRQVEVVALRVSLQPQILSWKEL